MTIQEKPSKKESIFSIRYTEHSDTEYRIWRSDWETDQFDIMPKKELGITKEIMKSFGIPVYYVDYDGELY